MGFINRMSDLVDYCESRDVADMVVGDAWFERIDSPFRWERPMPSRPLLIRSIIEQNVPEGATVLVVSQGIDEMLELEGRHGWHFPQNDDGSFQGHHPADSQDAIARLEKLREKGASYLAIPKPDLWWLEFYDGFKQHLDNRYRTVLDDKGGCAIFALGGTDSRDHAPGGIRTLDSRIKSPEL